MTFIAHIRESDKEIQSVRQHLLEVKELTEVIGAKIGIKHIAGLAGMLHDVGKYTEDFKEYIQAVIFTPDNAPKRGSVDHSTAGGKMLYNLTAENKDPHLICLVEVVGNVIISHHSYLHDHLNEKLESDYLRRVRDKKLDSFEITMECFFKEVMNESDFKEYVTLAIGELKFYLGKDLIEIKKKLMFLTKYVFSALIDSDWTNSREFEENRIEKISEFNFDQYYDSLLTKINSFEEGPQTPINKMRSKMSKECDDFADKPSGIYTLSIPTGGGKTFASLRYGLKHAKLYGKERVIYIVPYTTIIEQNADEIRKVLKDDENILEHHSNVIDDGDTHVNKKLKLAQDNWSAPIIFTTMVQYLNTFYANGRRNIRRLHNLSNAVIIFDEVQKVPTNCVSLFNESLNFLNDYAKSSILLCTATQPALDFVNRKLDVGTDPEIISDIDQVFESFKRVEIVDRVTGQNFNQDKLLAFINERMKEVNDVLVILNTKKAVKDLYEALRDKYDDVQVFHLSTSMCPMHRIAILEKVISKLKAEERVICVSTQLIEAGVDISFDCVIRSLAGLDSIAQAAGRCNRHGIHDVQYVYVIDYVEENLKFLKEIQQGQEITKKILVDLVKDANEYNGSLLSIQAMKYYFKEFYKRNESSLDYPINNTNETLIQLLMAEDNENPYIKDYQNKNKAVLPLIIKNSYQTAAREFRVIDSPTTTVIVPYGEEGKGIIADLNSDGPIEDLSRLFRRAQRYSVSVYSYQLDLLNQKDSLTTLFDDKVYALKEGAYDAEYGLNVDSDSKFDMYAF